MCVQLWLCMTKPVKRQRWPIITVFASVVNVCTSSVLVTNEMHTCYMKGVYIVYIGFLLQQMNQHKFLIKHANFIAPYFLWVRSFVPG